jgi:23S rRNA (adenine2503-C2)-methyltransferase
MISSEATFPGFIDPRSVSPKIFMESARASGINSDNARRLMGAIIGKYKLDPQMWAEDGIITKKFASSIPLLSSLKLEEIITSKVDGFQKLIFETKDKLKIETVIIPLHKEGAVSICLSSQVGCVMGCTFCATARMPVRRNLKSWEIVDQMQQARRIVLESGRRVTGAVFMGMGEPFLNYENVLTAAELLSYPVLNAIRSKAITISTVGLIDEIKRYTRENRPFRLSISLGAATDEKRKKLVPVAAKTPVKDVMAAARLYALSRKDRVMLSYVCISGENMGDEDAKALGELVKDTKVRLDLIEVTDTSGRYKRPSSVELQSFRDALNVYVKQPVVRRYSGGADIRAACGTLSAGAL